MMNRIDELPERLFARSLENMDGMSPELFNDIQDAAALLAEIRNAQRRTCEICDTPEQCLARQTPCYLSGELLDVASGMSASGQDPQGLEAKPASPTAEGGDAQ